MKSVAIVQARLGSVRLPRKVLRLIAGTPAIGLLFKRLSRARLVDQLVLATSDLSENDPLEDYVRQLGFEVFRGSEKDVLDRYYRCAVRFGADVVIRITGDCPLIDPAVVDGIVQRLHDTGADYASNAEPPTFPNGLDAEVFTFKSLETAWKETSTGYEREHVTPYLLESACFHRVNYANPIDHSQERWTVDEPADLEVVQKIFEHFSPDIYFGWEAVMDLKARQPEIFGANRHIPMNEGATMGMQQKLARRAAHILANRKEQPAPRGNCPLYFEKAAGCTLWDAEDREFTDFFSMSNHLLGYGNEEVNSAVKDAVTSGKCTVDGPEEIYLAEKLLDLHPWANKVVLQGSGAAAVSCSFALARRATGREAIALFEDTGGEGKAGTCRTLSEARQLLSKGEYAAILVKTERALCPEDAIISELRRLSRAAETILIFDERNSAFRQNFGGSHLASGVSPDLAIFGEAVSNGYPLGVVLGGANLLAGTVSVESLPGRASLVAALKTLEIMGRDKVWDKLAGIGESIMALWQGFESKYGLHFDQARMPSLCAFDVEEKASGFAGQVAERMLEHRYLAGMQLSVSIAHTPDIVGRFLETLARALEEVNLLKSL